MGLENDSKSLNTPTPISKEREEGKELMGAKATQYRALVARGIYLAQDRIDVAYAVKELSRRMSKPAEQDWETLKRFARYLLGRTRAILRYDYQEGYKSIQVWTDSDHAGCKETRKSTTGGVITMGNHTVKTWSSTQAVIAQSSGEAKFYAMVKGGSQGMGMQSMLKDLGWEVGIVIKTDASAAKGIANRRGLGKVRHIDVNQLWLQDQVANHTISIVKVGTKDNRADTLTKYVDGNTLYNHTVGLGWELKDDRHNLMPHVDSSSKSTEEWEAKGEEEGTCAQ